MAQEQTVPDFQEELARARKRLDRQREGIKQATEPAPDAIEEVPALQQPGQVSGDTEKFPPIEMAPLQQESALQTATGAKKPQFMAQPNPDDLVEKGNIDIGNRPHVKNKDGTGSSVFSASFNIDGVEVLVPRVSEDAQIMSETEALNQYQKTGKHLGKFRTVAAANKYADTLHRQQEEAFQTAALASSNFDDEMLAARAQLSNVQEEKGQLREDQKNWFTDVKATGKIAALYPVAGKLARGEADMELRKLTKEQVWKRISPDNQVAIESLAGKSINAMKWQDLQEAGRKYFGNTVATTRSSRDDPTLVQKKKKVWDEKLRQMMGYREGDWNEPSGEAYFPMARELIGGSIQSSNLNFYEHFIRPVFSKNTPELAEEMVEAVRLAGESYQQDTKTSVGKTMVAEDAIWYNPFTYFDEDTKDPYHDFTGFMHTMGQQSGNLAAMIIAARTGGRVGARSYTGSIYQKGMATEAIQKAQQTGARIGGAAAGGKAEMALIRDGVFSEVNQRIQKELPQEVWDNHEPYQRLIADDAMTPEEAKQVIAYSHANNAGDMAMVISGAMMGSPMGAFYGQMTGVSAGRQLARETLTRQMTKGALMETGQEMSQELSESVIGNLGVRKVDPDQDLWEGGLEAVTTAFFISAIPGALGGIHGDSGAGIEAERDKLIIKSQPWVNAANERWKHQNKIGPNTAFAKDASPQDQLKAMIELERLQKKEAEEFLKVRGEARVLLEKTNGDNDQIVQFDVYAAGYETQLAFIKKQQRRRTDSRKAAREEKLAQREMKEAQNQVQREVFNINENMRIVQNMASVQNNEGLREEQYNELVKMSYGAYTGRNDSNFALTQRGIRGMAELKKQINDMRDKLESSYAGPERRGDSALREEMAGLSDEEFEERVMVDSTTKLWNKRKWDQDEGTAPAVAVLDADSLSWVNDNMSHSAGTEYLQKIAREIQGLGGEFQSYRYGGDEFIVTGQNEAELQQVVEAAISRINSSERVEEGGQSVKVTVSVGYGTDFDSADSRLNQEKSRKQRSGERMDKRSAEAVPPSFKAVGGEQNPRQLPMFAIGSIVGGNDDLWNQNYSQEDLESMTADEWAEYVISSDKQQNRLFTNVTEVEEKHVEWVHETVDDFLPQGNTNNPPVTVVPDAEWLRFISPRQYKELSDLPFGTLSTRGLFSLDDPSHGVFLITDVIVSEARAQLKKGQPIASWVAKRYTVKEGDQVEIINDDGSIELGIIEQIDTTTVNYGAPASAAERRASDKVDGLRRKMDQLKRKESGIQKQWLKMGKEKKKDIKHPINRQLSDLADRIGEMQLETNKAYTALWRETSKKYQQPTGDKKPDKVYVAKVSDGTLIEFDPVTNREYGKKPKVTGTRESIAAVKAKIKSWRAGTEAPTTIDMIWLAQGLSSAVIGDGKFAANEVDSLYESYNKSKVDKGEIGNRLRESMRVRGVTIDQLADIMLKVQSRARAKTGTSKRAGPKKGPTVGSYVSYISNWINGKAIPSSQVVNNMVEIFDGTTGAIQDDMTYVLRDAAGVGDAAHFGQELSLLLGEAGISRKEFAELLVERDEINNKPVAAAPKKAAPSQPDDMGMKISRRTFLKAAAAVTASVASSVNSNTLVKVVRQYMFDPHSGTFMHRPWGSIGPPGQGNDLSKHITFDDAIEDSRLLGETDTEWNERIEAAFNDVRAEAELEKQLRRGLDKIEEASPAEEEIIIEEDAGPRIGRIRGRDESKTGWSYRWHTNLGNEEAAIDEALTKDMVQKVAADTLMHETVGHYGIRGITGDYSTYIKLTHAIVDAFPELVGELRALGYIYRDDFEVPVELLNDQNKALLGEEVMAWMAGRKLGTLDMRGMTLPQQSAIQKFLTWFKEQLIKMGFNNIYRRDRARRIRNARRRLYEAKVGSAEREAAHVALYGKTLDGKQAKDNKGKEILGLTHISPSGVRTGSWRSNKKVPAGIVVRSQKGFLNDADLLTIIARSHDNIRNGKNRWKFVGHDGTLHTLLQRDSQIFRKPVFHVMAEGLRPRTAEETISEEELVEPDPVPTLDEAYLKITGKEMPAGWKPVTPGDFKDEAKRLEAEMSEGKSKDEIKAMKKNREFPTPKTLYDEAMAGGADEGGSLVERAVRAIRGPSVPDPSREVQSLISSAEKEVKRRGNLLSSKRHKIEQLEKTWGRDAVANDEIPIFPEIATIQGFIDAIKHALPSAKGGKGYLTQMEVDASGVMDKLQPSLVAGIFDEVRGHPSLPPEINRSAADLFGSDRWAELKKPGSKLTKAEAKKAQDWMKSINELQERAGASVAYSEAEMNLAALENNNGTTVSSLVEVLGQYALSQQDENTATLSMLFGEDSAIVAEYIVARDNSVSAGPTESRIAAHAMDRIMATPIDINSVSVPKSWVMKLIETPVYNVAVSAPLYMPRDWRIHYEEITGNEVPMADDGAYIDYMNELPDTPENRTIKAAINNAKKKEAIEGPDIGYNEAMDKWVTIDADGQTARHWANLMPIYMIEGSYKGAVFWQTPVNDVKSGHFTFAEFRGADRGSSGQWAHARYGESYDASDVIPDSPNPDKTGRAMLYGEYQADHFQKGAKRFRSEAEKKAALIAYGADSRALESLVNDFAHQFTNLLIDPMQRSIDHLIDTITDEAITDRYSQTVVDGFTDEDMRLAKELHAFTQHSDVQNAIQKMKEILLEQQEEFKLTGSDSLEKITRGGYAPQVNERAEQFAILGDARTFEWLDARAMQNLTAAARMWIFDRGFEELMINYQSASPNSDEWEFLRGNGGLINVFRTGAAKGFKLDDPGKQLRHSIRRFVNDQGDATSNNQPGHRIPFMEAEFKKWMIDLMERLDQVGPRTTWTTDTKERTDELWNKINDQRLMRVVIPYADWANLMGRPATTIHSAIENWSGTTLSALGISSTPKISGQGEVTVKFIGSGADIDGMKEEVFDNLKEYIATSFSDSNIRELERQLVSSQRAVGFFDDIFNQPRKQGIEHWMKEFDIHLAQVEITQDENEPFKLLSERRANGLSVDDAVRVMTENNIEMFDKFLQRRWARHWVLAGDELKAEIARQGGSEETATPAYTIMVLEEYNDNPPGIYTLRLPVEWHRGNRTVTKWANAKIIKRKQGAEWDFLIDSFDNGRRDVSVWHPSNYSLRNDFATFIRMHYQSENIIVDPMNFKEFRDKIKKEKRRLDRIQNSISEEREKIRERVGNELNHVSLQPVITDDTFGDMSSAFMSVINRVKHSGYRSGVQKQQHMEKNEQWRVANVLWAFSEAVRNGYARMHIPAGGASGARGGFISDLDDAKTAWWHSDSIKYSLEKHEIRGKMRDILSVKANNVREPIWIDVTDDELLPLNPDRKMQDQQTDPLEGYFSGLITNQMGRDVAELIAQKLKESRNAAATDRLLISSHKKPSTDQEPSEETSFVVHDSQGNIYGTATSREEAETIRSNAADEKGLPTISGAIHSGELGGPIMFARNVYAGGPAFTLSSNNYQHTVAPPTLEGGRINYDLRLPKIIRAHIARFGLDLEEGYVRVTPRQMESVVMQEGGRKGYIIAEETNTRFPNITLEEIRGENYGWIINSDNGMVIQNVYPHYEAAAVAYDMWMKDNSVPDSGRVKIWQVTLNDELRKFHEQPVNPYLNVNFQMRSNPHLESALDKIGSKEPSLLDRFNAWRTSWKASFNTGTFDRFYGILHAMKATGQGNITAEDNPYIQARLSTGLESMMRGVMEFGYPVWNEGVVENQGRGLLKILEPISGDVEAWAAYMAGVRAKRLLTGGDEAIWQELTNPDTLEERIAEITAEGREKLWTVKEIEAMVELGETFPMFKEVATDYAGFNKKVLDFAESSGTINSETRPLWESADYIPFYRIVDDRLTGPLQKGNGIVNQAAPIKTLRGGDQNVGDLVHNIFMNLTNLVDASVKNNAALKAIDALLPTGIIQKQAHEFSKELIPMSQIGKVLQQHGMDVSTMPDEVSKGLQVMFAVQPPKGDGVISVLRDGKKEFYFTEDELLFRSLTALNMKAFGAWMNLLRAPKRLLTTFVTLDPGFMIANFIRDSMSAFVMSRDSFIPLYDGLKGFGEAITEGKTMRAMIGSGAAFDSGYINQGDPKSTRRLINNAMKDAGFQRTMLNTPRKLFEAYKRIGSAVENSNRIAVYQAAIRAGKSKAQAAYESKDLMDFSMGGDWPFIQFLIQTVPFMGARMQGLQRLGRGAAEHPVAFAVKGSLVGMAGLALWFAYRDDDRYKELEEWDKDTYFHWWVGDQHYRLPKGFEVGAIFNTIPERMFESMYSKETDAGKFLMRRFGFMIAETFNMNPIPQAVRPLTESLANHNFFTGRSIESPWEEERLPKDRYRYYTSPTMVELAAHMPDGMSTVLNGKVSSPLHLQNIYRGYTGTLGRYFLMASDALLRETGDYPIPPEMTMADYPVIGRFVRGDAPRRTKYEEEFYRELRVVNQVMNSIAAADKREDDPRMDDIEKEYAPYVEVANDFKNYRREISDLNREVRMIHENNDLSRSEKRKQIDQIQVEKNAIYEEAHRMRPSAVRDKNNAPDISTLIDGFDTSAPEANSPLKEQAPQTAQLLRGISGMTTANLSRLSKASSYQPRGT